MWSGKKRNGKPEGGLRRKIIHGGGFSVAGNAAERKRDVVGARPRDSKEGKNCDEQRRGVLAKIPPWKLFKEKGRVAWGKEAIVAGKAAGEH